MSRKVMIVSGNPQYYSMFENAGFNAVDYHPDYIDDACLVVFTGGSDVSPELYGHPTHPTTSYNKARDDREQAIFFDCVGRVPMVGICRGGQFLNVMCGGDMYQDITGHAIMETHPAVTYDKNIYFVTSTHHQMMRASDSGQIIMMGVPENIYEAYNRATIWSDELFKFVDDILVASTEAVFYENNNCLCFQPHPEFNGADNTRTIFFKMLNEFLNIKWG